MKNALSKIIFSFVILFGFGQTTFANENKTFFADKAKCEESRVDGSASFYNPTLNRPAPKSWKRAELKVSTCVQMETVQGFMWVVLMKGFEMAQNPMSKAWHAAYCTNRTNWNPDGSLSAAVPMQVPAVVQGFSGSTVLQACDAKCEAVKVCETANGTLDKMNPEGEWLCRLPDTKVRLIQPVIASGIVTYEWKGWIDPGMKVSGATPNISVGQPQISVTGQSCSTQGCSSRPVANFVSEVKASYCGIRTTDGRLFKLGHDKTTGQVTITDFTKNEGSGYSRMILGGVTGNDCDKVQEVIEKKIWPQMTVHFGLQNGCSIAARQNSSNNMVSQN